jgi:hypothetical protein
MVVWQWKQVVHEKWKKNPWKKPELSVRFPTWLQIPRRIIDKKATNQMRMQSHQTGLALLMCTW